MKLRLYSATLASSTHPKENQDSFFVDEANCSFGVFDGVGGIEYGNYAASWCAECFRQRIHNVNFEEAFKFCHNFLKEKALKKFSHEIATTAATIKIFPERHNSLAVWGSVGDSRVYHYSSNKLSQVSVDDSLLTQALEKGWIDSVKAEKIDQATDLSGFNKVEKNLFEGRNIITQALGIGEMKPRVGKFNVKKGDLIILTTDGVHDNLMNSEVEEILKKDLKDPAKEFVRVSAQVSDGDSLRAKADDMTAVVVKLE